jgi:hypothetical protein
MAQQEGDLIKTPKGEVLIARGGQLHKIADNPGEFEQLKALKEGRMAIPSGFAVSKPYWQQMLGKLAVYDPKFDLVDASARSKMRASATSGDLSKQMRTLGTAIGHVDHLNSMVDDLHNFDGIATPLNHFKRGMDMATGQNHYTNFDTAAPAVAGEVNKLFVGGSGDKDGRHEFREPLNSTRSPSQLHGAMAQMMDLMDSRANEIRQQYQRGMGTTKDPFEMYAPETAKALQRLRAMKQAHGEKMGAQPVPQTPAHTMGKDETLKALGFN